MPSFAVRYRSRGQVREVRWSDGRLSAEPLVETLIDVLVQSRRVVQARPGEPSWVATLDEPEPAALTILEALYEVGAHIIEWRGIDRGGSGNPPMR